MADQRKHRPYTSSKRRTEPWQPMVETYIWVEEQRWATAQWVFEQQMRTIYGASVDDKYRAKAERRRADENRQTVEEIASRIAGKRSRRIQDKGETVKDNVDRLPDAMAGHPLIIFIVAVIVLLHPMATESPASLTIRHLSYCYRQLHIRIPRHAIAQGAYSQCPVDVASRPISEAIRQSCKGGKGEGRGRSGNRRAGAE
ncbi:uncharacterized protein EV420DRAFT_1640662 [Desarmillaria tabescens]|uniref:Uncharacterized protein n=1 Tax=Armillaria tabescens TaxID=1929756 RepID=A0AA39N8U7_ARMTA|nr:uncharacterized protein EV420DRAFT_1640662 [Desarmillaria tabescens]KAK0461166.1 hypothetical protein EV420DRAFT_1640662 [Desarmillaria tabescens]